MRSRADRTQRLVLALAVGLAGLLGVACPASENLGPPELHWVKPASTTTDKVVVFVHGFNSNSQTAWTNKSSGAYWPDLIKGDPDLQTFAVLTAGYHSPLLRRAGTIEQAATTVGSRLRDENLYSRFNQVVFIAHSTGGLVVRRLLRGLFTPDAQAP